VPVLACSLLIIILSKYLLVRLFPLSMMQFLLIVGYVGMDIVMDIRNTEYINIIPIIQGLLNGSTYYTGCLMVLSIVPSIRV
jgi:uncharacterized membrane protein